MSKVNTLILSAWFLGGSSAVRAVAQCPRSSTAFGLVSLPLALLPLASRGPTLRCPSARPPSLKAYIDAVVARQTKYEGIRVVETTEGFAPALVKYLADEIPATRSS